MILIGTGFYLVLSHLFQKNSTEIFCISESQNTVQITTLRKPVDIFTGLLRHKDLSPGKGILLEGCRCVHTIGMSFPIDIIFLDGNKKILKIKEFVNPGNLLVFGTFLTKHTLEMRAGEAKRLGLKKDQFFTEKKIY